MVLLLLPLETVLMRRFGLWYCSARKLSLEARANLGMEKNELWTPALYAECCRVFESSKGCYKISPRALSLISMASNLTATVTIPTTNAVNGGVEGGVIKVVDTTEAEAKLVKKDQEDWRKILKPSLGKIKKSKRNKLPPPTSKRTTKKSVSKDINVTKAVNVTNTFTKSKNNQVEGESSTEGESDSNNEINETGFPINIVQFSFAESNTSSSGTKKSKSTKSTKMSSSSKTAKSSSSKKTKASTTSKSSNKAVFSTATKEVKTPVKTTTTDNGVHRERSSASTTTKKPQDSASVRQRAAVIKYQSLNIVERMVSPIPATHWSSPIYPH